MQIARRSHTVGNKKRWIVNYCQWLGPGDTLSSCTVTSSSSTCTVSGAAVLPSANKVVFFLNGGVLNETFTVSVQVTDSRGEIKNDTISFTVIAA